MRTITPVVLCGGSGTRLWPLSRAGFPKQFLALAGDESLFQQTLLRLGKLQDNDTILSPILVITNEEHRFLALEQWRELQVDKELPAQFLLEPCARNTAPALTLAALQATENGQDPVLLVTPSDQTIGDDAAYIAALRNAINVAEQDNIVVLGIKPDRAETGYGYIKSTGDAGKNGERVVNEFAEKPDAKTAQGYLQSGLYTWNSGMFVLRASVWLKAIEHFKPQIYRATLASWQAKKSETQFIRPDKAAFERVASDSIDYAVMERCPGSAFPIQMISLDAGWSDLGAWDAVWQVGQKDAAGNVTHGDVLLADSKNSLIHATTRAVAVVGLNNIVVVETADAVLVAEKGQSQNVKQIVQQLTQQKREEHNLHRKVHRPWGWYDSIDEAERFKVKRIRVKPGASLSLQKHHHRAEHWIVVTGTAEVTCGDKVMLLTENQSTYIPLGEVHRLVNPGTLPLEIIEVQSGSYLGEDDIVRLQDTYGRTQ